MSNHTTPVSFRLDDHYLERLREEACKRGLSPGQYVRSLVLDTLEDGGRLQIVEQVAEVQKEIDAIRVDLAAAVTALLVGAGKVEKDNAQQWVRENLRP